MADDIRSEFIVRHQLFTTKDLRECMLQGYLEKYWESDNLPDFNCTSSFVGGFMTSNWFSRRRQDIKRRPASRAESIKRWIISLTELLRTRDNNLIMNCDERVLKTLPLLLRVMKKIVWQFSARYPRMATSCYCSFSQKARQGGLKIPKSGTSVIIGEHIHHRDE
jgi:hypothetical protein